MGDGGKFITETAGMLNWGTTDDVLAAPDSSMLTVDSWFVDGCVPCWSSTTPTPTAELLGIPGTQCRGNIPARDLLAFPVFTSDCLLSRSLDEFHSSSKGTSLLSELRECVVNGGVV